MLSEPPGISRADKEPRAKRRRFSSISPSPMSHLCIYLIKKQMSERLFVYNGTCQVLRKLTEGIRWSLFYIVSSYKLLLHYMYHINHISMLVQRGKTTLSPLLLFFLEKPNLLSNKVAYKNCNTFISRDIQL